jgi:hypothetical protein
MAKKISKKNTAPEQVTKNSVVNRTFSYSIGSVSLNFTLRTDIKTELVDFLKILESAHEEVTAQLEQK